MFVSTVGGKRHSKAKAKATHGGKKRRSKKSKKSKRGGKSKRHGGRRSRK